MNNMLREVKIEDAVGMALAHDLTQIIPEKFKGRLFKKGHVLREEDLPHLRNIGKEHIYVMQLQKGYLHEDEAAMRMAKSITGNHVEYSDPSEGKVTLKSAIHGLAKVNKRFIHQANSIGEVAMATVKTNTVVQPRQALAGTRVIPLIVAEEKVLQIEQLAVQYRQSDSEAAVYVKPFRSLRAGLVTTGGEVFSGRIQDKFGPVVKKKLAELGSEVIEQRFAPDDMEQIIAHIRYFQAKKADLILMTGGMSVDPDDRTPGAIKRSGASIVSYGTPMLPGSMLMMAYLEDIPIMGLPGCVMHDPFTSFDVLLPRICAGEKIVREDIVELGYGGLYGC